jgi:hypothetical protein
MRFLGGFVGVAQDPATLALRPAIGWGVGDAIDAPEPSREELERQAFAAMTRPPLPYEVTLVAGRASREAWLTPDEFSALSTRIQQAATAGGVRLAVVPAGDSTYAGLFPEAPLRCRLVLGVPCGSVRLQSRVTVSATELRRAFNAVRAAPDAVWSNVAALIPGGLEERETLHLAVSGSHLRGEARARGGTLATVATSGSTLAIVDLPPGSECEIAASYDA